MIVEGILAIIALNLWILMLRVGSIRKEIRIVEDRIWGITDDIEKIATREEQNKELVKEWGQILRSCIADSEAVLVDRMILLLNRVDYTGKMVESTNKAVESHLEQVKAVIAAAIPNMEASSFTPEEVVKAFKEMEEDTESSLKEQLADLENLISGVDA